MENTYKTKVKYKGKYYDLGETIEDNEVPVIAEIQTPEEADPKDEIPTSDKADEKEETKNKKSGKK